MFSKVLSNRIICIKRCFAIDNHNSKADVGELYYTPYREDNIISGNTISIYTSVNLEDIVIGYKGAYKAENFEVLAKFRENRINDILN